MNDIPSDQTPDDRPLDPDPVTAPIPTDPVVGAHDPAGTDAPEVGTPGDEPPGGETPPGAAAPHKLRRDTEHGLLAGVAAGLARALDIDVVIVRVAFVALTVLGGSGALIYLAAWLLMPADDDEHPLARQWARRRPDRRSLFLIFIGVVLAVIAVSDLFSTGPWWPHRDGGVGLTLAVVALVLAVGLVAGSGGNRTAASRLRWFFLMLVLSVVGVLVVAAATVFSIEAVSGVPLRGGIGNTQWHPTAASQVSPDYRLAMGNLNVDLSAVPFRQGTTHVTASVGIGRLSVEVPAGPTVSVVAHSGLGDVQVFGQDNGGLSTVRTTESVGTGPASRAHLVINADAGVGQVQVIRTSSEPQFS